MKIKPKRFQAKRLGAMVVAGTMLLQTVAPAYAAVSQLPGLYIAPPDANVMFSLDDSGSMEDEAIPDDNNGIGSSMWSGTWNSGGTGNKFKITSQTWRYYRSAQGNPIYYNPKVRYTPWPYAGDDTQTYPNAVTTAACYYPSTLPVQTTLPLPATPPAAIACGTNIRNLADRVVTNGPDDLTENKGYWPATYFTYNGASGALLQDGQSNQTANNTQGNWTKVEIKSTVPTYPKVTARTDCLGASCTYAEEIQNFANWFQYYRSRALMAKGAVSKAFSKQGSNLRAGYASLHGAATLIDGYSTPLIKLGVRKFQGTDRIAFYAKVYGTGTTSGTPLRYVADVIGQYFDGTSTARRVPGNPWSEDPSNLGSVGKEHACRRSFHVLTSDGYWNTIAQGALTTVGNADDFTGYTAPAWPTGKPGAPASLTFSNGNAAGLTIDPFKDNNSETLSDFAAYYWKRDLRPDLPNAVSFSTRDPAYWQHLTTYTVGIGVSSTNTAITNVDPTVAAAQREALVANKTAVNWGVFPNNDGLLGDDFVHASMSGRGRFFLALDPTGLANSLASALAEATGDPGSLANVVTSSPQVTDTSTTTAVYQATYNPGEWSGRFYAFDQALTGLVNTTVSGALWEASNKMPAPGVRNIYTWNPTSSAGSTFTSTGLTATQLSDLNNDLTLLDFLRGSDAKEVAQGGTFRDRSRYTVAGVKGGVLGDIVNGSPIKGPSAGGGYERLPAGSPGRTSYATYRSIGNTALNNMRDSLFLGANDGMLHAFDRLTGIERFAYVPNSVFSVPRSLTGIEKKLKMLSDPLYSHRFTVDGPPQIGDGFIGPDLASSDWTTLLLSSTGAGARSVFVMDIKNPKVETGGFSQSKVLWEFSEANDPVDMGYVINYPHIARMRDGTWVAIFGNGYDSASGQAALFIRDLRTGAHVAKFLVGPVGGNGLSQPNFTVNASREVTAIYAGDLKGNLWKFDVDSDQRGDWKVAFGSLPAYTPLYAPPAADLGKQPITVMPEITFHPNGGALLSFGTGKLFETEDTNAANPPNVNLGQQALYGIWDKPAETTGFTGNASLVQQTANGSLAAVTDLSGTTANAVDWSTKRGWYLNLNSGGERVTVNPQQAKSTLLVVANKPDSDPCNSGGTSRIFGLDPITGAAPAFAVFDANADGNINTADKGYNVKSISYAVLSLPALQTKKPFTDKVVTERVGTRGQTGERLGGVENKPPSAADCKQWLLAGGSNTAIAGFDISLCAANNPRISWRQLK